MTTSPAALKLSEEAQDLICAYVSDFSNQDAMNTLYSLTLTSRDFLESAQHALYKAPLRALLARPTWSRAESLLHTLKTRPGLALHVRFLYALGKASASLARQPTADRGEDVARQLARLTLDPAEQRRAACRWAYDVARRCIQSTALTCVLGTEAQAEGWRALARTHDRLSNIRLSAEPPSSNVDPELFTTWASGWKGKLLRKVVITGLDWSDAATSEPRASRLPFAAKTFRLEELHLDALQIARCIPQSLAQLKELAITTHGSGNGWGSPIALDLLFQLIGRAKKLRTFAFDALHQHGCMDFLVDYGDGHNGPILPSSTFTHFPFVTSLTLRHLRGMTIDNLVVLAHHSDLKTLDLQWSHWDLNIEDDVDLLVSALDLFPSLKTLDLGYFAVLEDDPFELQPVELWATNKEVEFSFQACEEEDCDEEEGFHDYHGYGCDCHNEGYDFDVCDDSECEGDCGLEHVYW